MPVVSWVYDHVDEAAAGLPGFENLAGMLEGYDGQAFIDGFHYSPSVLRRIAERILARLERDRRSDGLIGDRPASGTDDTGLAAAIGATGRLPVNRRRRPAQPAGGRS